MPPHMTLKRVTAMVWVLSKRSLERREGVNPKLIAVNDLALQISTIDFGIPRDGGVRTAKRQMEIFNRGRSLCDGTKKLSYHQSGNALDVYAFVAGKASWEPDHLAMVAAAHLQAASQLGIKLEWGGFWVYLQTAIKGDVTYGWDCGHIQLMDV